MAPPVRRGAAPAGRKAAPAASLLPENAAGGFEVPEGDYLWKDVYTALHDYNGTVAKDEAKPAIFVLLQSVRDETEEYTVPYLAGKQEFIMPSDDGTHFVHPDGESTPTFYKQGDAIKLLKSLLNGGYPHDKMESDSNVSQFIALKAHMVPAPKNKGKSASKDDDDAKTVPIVEKIIAMPGAKGNVPTRTTATASRTAPTGAASRTAQRATQQDNGEPSADDLDAVVVEKIQEALMAAGENGLTRVKLAGTVWLTAKNAKDADASNYRGIAGNKKWLEEHAEEGGWQIEGDQITLA